MKRIIVTTIAVLVLPVMMAAQNLPNRFIKAGLLTGKGTLAFGKPIGFGGTNMYVAGSLEYYLEQDISIKSGIWMFLGTTGDNDVLQKNHTIFTGLLYHVPTNSGFDPYIGFEPGISWTQVNIPDNIGEQPFPYNVSEYKQSASPVVAFGTGVNYYAGNVVHLFVEAKYIHGIHVSDVPAVNLNEFRFAFGFGWNFWVLRKYGVVIPDL